ncbi:hypothetical protein MPSEU_000387600 [Mayamaea pseudoterrestris]|nr:hypothetical protein MPSEU_000387600 [Mayamaea pseudoterrestris]
MASKGTRVLRYREYSADSLPKKDGSAADDSPSFREFEIQLIDDIIASKKVHTSSGSPNLSKDQQSDIFKLLAAPCNRCKTIIKDLLLPIGYPSSVAEGYIEYQFYDSLQGLCSYLRSVLCSAQVLQAAGVGTAEATALSAAMTWALKDGCAMLGGLIFSYQVASVLDSHVKEFRFFADLINNVGLTLDMMAPYFKGHLLAVSSAAGLCKTLCGLSAGATKSSLTQHFAIEGNMADVTAKESTQETFVSLLGMILGVGLAHRLQSMQASVTSSGNDSYVQQLQWIIFTALTLLHIWSNYKGVALLRLRTLNRERAEIVLDKVIDAALASSVTFSDVTNTTDEIAAAIKTLPPPNMVFESLSASAYKMLLPGRLCLDASLADIIAVDVSVLNEFRNERYVLAVNGKRHVLVCLLLGGTCRDQIKAFVHAQVMLRFTADTESALKTIVSASAMSSRVHSVLNSIFHESGPDPSSISLMDEMINKNWDVEHRLYVGFSRRRFSYDIKSD